MTWGWSLFLGRARHRYRLICRNQRQQSRAATKRSDLAQLDPPLNNPDLKLHLPLERTPFSFFLFLPLQHHYSLPDTFTHEMTGAAVKSLSPCYHSGQISPQTGWEKTKGRAVRQSGLLWQLICGQVVACSASCNDCGMGCGDYHWSRW